MTLEGANIWIVGDVLHSRVARSNILAFQAMGATVTVAGPPTLMPRDVEALGVEVRTTLDDLREADVVYALRMQRERMGESYVPSLREYAAAYQIDGRRLGARQLLMHPGPVNRGVELSGDVVDSPQSLMLEQVAAGVVVRMAVLYEVLAVDPRRRARHGVPDRHEHPLDERARPRARSAGRPARARRARARPAHRARRRRMTSWSATARSPRSARPARSTRPPAPRSSTARAAGSSRPSSTRTCTCARPARSTRRTSRPAPAPRPPAASARSIAMPNTDPVVDSPSILRGAARDRARATRASRSASWAPITRGLRGEELTEMNGAARARARSASPTTASPVVQRGHAAPRAPVPAPLRRRPRPARGGPAAVRRGRHARGRRSARCSASRAFPASASRRSSRGTPRSPGYEGGAVHMQHLQLRGVGPGGRAGQGARLPRHRARRARTTSASPTRRSARSTRA